MANENEDTAIKIESTGDINENIATKNENTVITKDDTAVKDDADIKKEDKDFKVAKSQDKVTKRQAPVQTGEKPQTISYDISLQITNHKATHKSKLFNCSVCNIEFETREEHDLHRKTHEEADKSELTNKDHLKVFQMESVEPSASETTDTGLNST